jgi:hypothetical protein
MFPADAGGPGERTSGIRGQNRHAKVGRLERRPLLGNDSALPKRCPRTALTS